MRRWTRLRNWLQERRTENRDSLWEEKSVCWATWRVEVVNWRHWIVRWRAESAGWLAGWLVEAEVEVEVDTLSSGRQGAQSVRCGAGATQVASVGPISMSLSLLVVESRLAGACNYAPPLAPSRAEHTNWAVPIEFRRDAPTFAGPELS